MDTRHRAGVLLAPVLLFFSAASVPAGDASPLFEARARFMFARLDGSASSGESETGVTAGHTLSFGGDLGVRTIPIVEARVFFNPTPEDRFEAGFLFGLTRGRREQAVDFTFDEGRFLAGQAVRTRIRIEALDAGYSRRVWAPGDASVRAGIGLEYWDADIVLRTPVEPPGKSAEGEGMRALVPFLQLRGEVPVAEALRIDLEVRYGPVAIPRVFPEPARVWFVALEGAVNWQPVPWMCLEIGTSWRHVSGLFAGKEPSGRYGRDRFVFTWIGPSVTFAIRF